MDVAQGFQMEQPDVFVPRGISESELRQPFPRSLRHVTRGYYTTRCTSLRGLKHVLGFHFADDRLTDLEFFFSESHDPDKQFAIWQRHLEATFGSPTETETGAEGFPSHTWTLAGTNIHHVVTARFELEEYVRITRPITSSSR